MLGIVTVAHLLDVCIEFSMIDQRQERHPRLTNISYDTSTKQLLKKSNFSFIGLTPDLSQLRRYF